MTTSPESDWTNGAAKWAMVVALGTASIFGMVWSITGRQPLASALPAATSPEPAASPVSEPGRVILREDLGDGPTARSAAPRSGTRQPAPTARLNVNTATASELELLPGIGPALAGRIVEDREVNGTFNSVDDLDRVKGIGPKTIERIRALCTVD